MPELPEVEAFKEYLEHHCMHQQIAEVHIKDKQVIKRISAANFQKSLADTAFKKVERRGKYLVIHLQHSKKLLVMHFGMTGFLYYTKDLAEKVRFSCVAFVFKNNSVLHWISIRKFEKLWLVDFINEIKPLHEMGPEPLALTKKQFLDLIAHNSKKNIKAFLMDQSTIAGIGNEYSDEIMFQSGIDPHHKLADLSAAKIMVLYTQMRKVLKYFVKRQSTDINSERDNQFFSKADRASFNSTYLQAHRHTDMLCPKNPKHHLKKATIAGRTSYYCPKDQQ